MCKQAFRIMSDIWVFLEVCPTLFFDELLFNKVVLWFPNKNLPNSYTTLFVDVRCILDIVVQIWDADLRGPKQHYVASIQEISSSIISFPNQLMDCQHVVSINWQSFWLCDYCFLLFRFDNSIWSSLAQVQTKFNQSLTKVRSGTSNGQSCWLEQVFCWNFSLGLPRSRDQIRWLG